MLIAEGTLGVGPAQAREERFSFDLPAGPLAASLARFSEITGLSVGYPGALPMVTARPIKGTMSAEKALHKLLDGTRLRAVKLAPHLYRLEVAPQSGRSRAVAARNAAPAGASADIVVTGQKRELALDEVPLSVSILPIEALRSSPRPLDSKDVGLRVEGLATTNLGPGRNRQFIRGVADSPFLGQSQSTVAVQVDDARVTFNAPDPDLRLIDVEQVEILKGPQGPLYGSGALGGIYHIVTRRPDLDGVSAWGRLSASAVEHGGTGAGGEAVVNLPLIEDRLAVRAVAYRLTDGGWIDNAASGKDSNSTRTQGLRVGLKWQPSQDWSVDLGYTAQDIATRDSQYVLSAGEGLIRPGRLAEPTDNDFEMFHATVAGRLGGLELLSVTSHVGNAVGYALDASDVADDFGLSGTVRFDDDRHYSLFNQEIRLSSGKGSPWVAGASFLRAAVRNRGTLTATDGSSQTVEQTHRVVMEAALFGEVTIPLWARLDTTLGARIYQSRAEDESDEAERRHSAEAKGMLILSPSLALSYRLQGGGLVYLRYARAMRPGGLAPTGMTTSGRFDADELGSFDLGMRRSLLGGHLKLSGSAYYTDWHDIQSDYLLADGLVSTRNAGRARIIGMEVAADWQMGGGYTLTLGGAAQDARLTHSAAGIELSDRHLPIAPDVTGRASLSRRYTLGRWSGQSAIQANYIGHARLSFDDDLDRSMRPYATVALNSMLERDGWTAAFQIDNLFDVRGDSFAFGNPFSIRTAQQYTPLRPRAVTISLARQW
ncbi:TonB-dependent receptor domain-containing protein [Sphingobium sp.]|uniref:TonB-dependent receptor n=1 Tax=Sphingobium sp. TaxID=1912891 RepID=UPI0028BD4053|nr:TonB-dependent receptor [Sphingobium sp.]